MTSRRATYQRKSGGVVEAEQATLEHCPRGVEPMSWGLSSNGTYTMKTPWGRIIIPLGTWIVTDEEGTRPVAPEVFVKVYRPATLTGRP